MYKSKRSKATAITDKVKREVHSRDNGCCVICGKQANDPAHYISRANGGLGIPENIVCLCRECHHNTDNSPARQTYLKQIKQYLDRHYPDFTDEERKYKK